VLCVVQSNYRHWLDYVTYLWASDSDHLVDNGTHKYSVTFSATSLSSLERGSYCLMYFSAASNCVVAYSHQLQVTMQALLSVS